MKRITQRLTVAALFAVAAGAFASPAQAQVTHYRGADGALYITGQAEGPLPPKVSNLESPNATCVIAVNADVGMGVRIDRCAVWVMKPTRQQVERFGKLPWAYQQFVSRPPL